MSALPAAASPQVLPAIQKSKFWGQRRHVQVIVALALSKTKRQQNLQLVSNWCPPDRHINCHHKATTFSQHQSCNRVTPEANMQNTLHVMLAPGISGAQLF